MYVFFITVNIKPNLRQPILLPLFLNIKIVKPRDFRKTVAFIQTVRYNLTNGGYLVSFFTFVIVLNARRKYKNGTIKVHSHISVISTAVQLVPN